jgi:hypothetical protein
MMPDGNLGKEKSANCALRDVKPVDANFDLSWIKALQRREDGDFDMQIGKFTRFNGLETRILQRGGDGAMGDGDGERIRCRRLSNAASQASTAMESDEDAAEFRDGADNISREPFAPLSNSFSDGQASELEQ